MTFKSPDGRFDINQLFLPKDLKRRRPAVVSCTAARAAVLPAYHYAGFIAGPTVITNISSQNT